MGYGSVWPLYLAGAAPASFLRDSPLLPRRPLAVPSPEAGFHSKLSHKALNFLAPTKQITAEQWFSALAAHYYHLQFFKRCQCQGPSPESLISLVWGMAWVLGLLSVQLELRTTGLKQCFSHFNVHMNHLGSC